MVGWDKFCLCKLTGNYVAVVRVTTTAIPGDIRILWSPVGGSSTNYYVNNRVLSQCLLLNAHTIGNEKWMCQDISSCPVMVRYSHRILDYALALRLEIPGCYLTHSCTARSGQTQSRGSSVMNEQVIQWFLKLSHECPTVLTANASVCPALWGHSAIWRKWKSSVARTQTCHLPWGKREEESKPWKEV